MPQSLRLAFNYSLLILLLAAGCKPNQDTPAPDTSKKPDTGTQEKPDVVISEETSCKQVRYYSKSDATNAQGYFAGSTITTQYTYLKDTTYKDGEGTVTVKFTYDQAGFLLKRSSVSQYNPADSPPRNNIDEISYTYANGKLIESIHTVVQNGQLTGKIIYRYEYDTQGNLAKQTYIDSVNNKIIRTFEKGVQKKYTIEDGGRVIDLTSNFNAEGFEAINKLSPTDETRNVYDSNGNLFRKETWVNGKLYGYTVYEFGEKNRQDEALATYKGHPKVPDIYGSRHNLITKATIYQEIPTKDRMGKRNEASYTYQLNKSGFIDVAIINATKYSVEEKVEYTYLITETYTYVGCK